MQEGGKATRPRHLKVCALNFCFCTLKGLAFEGSSAFSFFFSHCVACVGSAQLYLLLSELLYKWPVVNSTAEISKLQLIVPVAFLDIVR